MECYLKSTRRIWLNVTLSFRITSLLTMLAGHALPVMITVPLNEIVLVGQRLELKCGTNKSKEQWIDWTFFQNSQLNDIEYRMHCASEAGFEDRNKKCINIVSSDAISVSQAGRYNVSNDKNGTLHVSTLSVDTVDLSYAGVYQCADVFDSKAYSFITVIDPFSNCSITAASSTLNCSFVYSGRTPRLQWISSNSSVLINCTQNGINDILCVIQFSSFSLYEITSCNLEIANETEGSEISPVITFTDIFRSNLYGYLRCHSATFTELIATLAVSGDFVALVSASISGVAVLVIIIIFLIWKCDMRKNNMKSDAQTTPQKDSTLEGEYELIEVAADSTEYTSLQQIQGTDDAMNIVLEGAVYTQLNEVSLSNQTETQLLTIAEDQVASREESELIGEVGAAANMVSTAEYTSLQQNFELEDTAYAELCNVSSPNQTDTSTAMGQVKFVVSQYENVDRNPIKKLK